MLVELIDIAEFLFFGIVKNEAMLILKLDGQWEYRKGKTILDVNKAMRMGVKLGHGKVEYELSGIALYLNDVFKKCKKGVMSK